MSGDWWQFVERNAQGPATGEFRAAGADAIGRLYFPLVNEGGMLSWTSPRLHGSPAAGHNAYLSPPLTAEDLPHVLIHRDVWIVEDGQPPWSLAGLSPEGLTGFLRPPGPDPDAWVDAGPGWFSLARRDRGRRFVVEATLWCPADVDAPLELMRVTITNTSSSPLRLRPYAAIPMFARSADNIRDHRHVTILLHRVARTPNGVRVCPTMTFDERGHTVNTLRYWVDASGPEGRAPTGVWAIEEQFLGEGGTFAAPAAVWQGVEPPAPNRATLEGREAIGGFRFAEAALAPGEGVEYTLAAGISDSPRDAARRAAWARRPETIMRSLEATRAWWRAAAQRIAFSTGRRHLDHWLAWVALQPTLRRLYGNSYLPQFDYGRGGRGWRDLWQDGLALLLCDPAPVRAMILQNIGGVRIDGSNATIIGKDGSFIADRNNIPRTWMDHGIWPLYTTLLYIDQTGDWKILFAPREYFRDPQLFRCRQQDPSWTDEYGDQLRTRAGRIYTGSVLEHLLVQHLTAFFNVGGHNLCRLEGADWNDGLDMARHRGESVAFSALYAWNLERLAQLARLLAARGTTTIALAEELRLLLDRLPGQRRVAYGSASAKRRQLERYLQTVARDLSGRRITVSLEHLAADLEAKHHDLAARIREHEWLPACGEGWFNGYYDDAGKRVEGRWRGRVRMTLTGQVFPIMAGIASEAQLDRVIAAVNRHLRDPRSGGVRLNTDFGGVQPTLGRAFAFAYGDKENGAVFSHMAVMYAYALYRRRRAHEGRRVWSALYQMATNQSVAKIFPCLPEYFNADGRGLYCYLTGSASWLIYLLLTQVFGVRGELGDLVLDPQLTRDDFGERTEVGVETNFAGRRLAIAVTNPQRLEAGAYEIAGVHHDQQPLASSARPEGGVRIARRLIAHLPNDHLTRLTVTLRPRRR